MGVTYDGHARLTRYSAGTASQAMLYNGADERIRVITTPAVGLADTRLYLYDLDHRIVGEYGPTGAADIKAEYIWTLPEVGASGPTGGDDGAGGYMPLATAVGQTGALNWVHGHHLGTPILTTNAAGQAITPTGTAILGFPGQFANALLLSGAQHYYNRYRDYNFATGRYIQADPIGLAGDDNPYAYAAGNPLRYTDPSGLQRAPRGGPPRLPSSGYPNIYDMQIQALNARGRAISPRYQGFQQMGYGATAENVTTARDMFARTQAAWAATRRICLGAGEPGANYRAPRIGNNATPIIVTGSRYAIPVPIGAFGPVPTRAPGFQFTGGSGGHGFDNRVASVRIMDANRHQGPRVVYGNDHRQRVDPWTGLPISNSDPNAHFYFRK